jgi:glycosyltransferase involved in cell wall biosynthesis
VSKVSFVICAYERPQHLRTCLASLVGQTETDWDAIVVDNSVNKALAVEQRWLCNIDSRIRYLHTEPMTVIPGPHIRCLYTATEIGVERTDAEWLCFANDDSYYTPWFLERMLKAAEANDWEFVYCDLVLGGPVEHHPMMVAPHECQIDKTCFLVKRKWFEGFKDKVANYHCADGRFVEDLVRRGVRHGRVPQMMCVHN